MLLFAIILLPLIFGLAVALGPERRAREIALVGAIACLAVAAYTCVQFEWGSDAYTMESPHGFQMCESVPFLTSLGGYQRESGASTMPIGGISFSVGVDAIAMLLIALTAFLGPIAVLCSWTAITERPKTFFAWLMVLQAAMTGVFASRDLVLFYICFEFTLIPMWVLINLYGSTNRKRAATKFFLFTFTGSVVALAALLYVAWAYSRIAGNWTFDIGILQQAAARMSPREQALVLAGLMAGFAVKVPLFPVHTWLPLAHTEAPTAGSVILAGVLLKLGTYALYRFVLPFCPHAVVEYAPAIAVLCIIGILYGGLICWVQTDVKKLVAYSSVAHLGFCVLGLFALNSTGITGSVMYMINHGLSTGALFVLIGMIYERYHTRSMKELGGLAARMPIWATFMVFFTMASVGLPGLNGFVSEFLCLLGAFQAGESWTGLPGATAGRLGFWYTLVAGIGMIVAAMYLLYMVGRVVWGPLVEPAGHAPSAHGAHAHGSHGHEAHGHDAHAAHDQHGASHGTTLPTDLNAREIGILVPLAIACLGLGLYPKPLLDAIQRPVSRTIELVHRAPVSTPAEPARTQPAHAEVTP